MGMEKLNDFLKSSFGWLPARIALALLAWLGFINLYLTRVNVSVILVAMVKKNRSSSVLAPCVVKDNVTAESNEKPDNPPRNYRLWEPKHTYDVMDWDETIQGFILGSFFYGYFVTQIPGGRIAEIYGTKWVFGVSILGGGICALVSPALARLHYGAFIFLRIIQGIFQGASWPSMHACLVQWIPPLERPRFIGLVYFGTNLSTAITLPLCGLIIDLYGWPAAFYITGCLPIIWSLFWFSLMYNYPSQHPRISQKELEYIQTAVKMSGTSSGDEDQRKGIPWKSILTSTAVWAVLIGDFGNCWALGLFITQLPTYMNNILGFSIKENGLISALPFLFRYAGAIIMSTTGDWLLTNKYLSIRSTRRIFSTIAMWIPALLLLGVSFSGCDWKAIVALLCAALFFGGAVTTSTIVNPADIAPNYSGTLFGLLNMTSTIAFFTVPVVTGIMTDGQQTLVQWQKVFWICVPVYLITHTVFFLFVSGDVQPWNFPRRRDSILKKYTAERLDKRETEALNRE